ncbi:MAG: nitroreductase family protein, partial [Flavobacteriales bacterium]|nr:nitroreductase family protein [Flavobacteriales bacterium]
MAEVDIFSKAPKHGYTEVANPVDVEAFKTIVENRRSVRVYDDSPIPESVMKECLRLA